MHAPGPVQPKPGEELFQRDYGRAIHPAAGIMGSFRAGKRRRPGENQVARFLPLRYPVPMNLKEIFTQIRTPLIALAAMAYFVLVVVSHESVSLLYLEIFKRFGRSTMETSMHLGSTVMGVAVLGACLFVLNRRKRLSLQILLLWAGMALCIILADVFFVVTNIERIHYIQYALLSILIRTIVSDDYFALFLTVLAGIADEAVQYLWAPEYTRYLDFNDFVFNLLGGLLGILLYLTFFSENRPVSRGLVRTKVAVYGAVGLVLALLCAAMWAGRIIPCDPRDKGFHVIDKREGRTVFVLSFVKHPDFWSVTDYGTRYHVLSPVEGTALLGVLLLGCRFLLKERRSNGGAS